MSAPIAERRAETVSSSWPSDTPARSAILSTSSSGTELAGRPRRAMSR
jgi:hypothetical protein